MRKVYSLRGYDFYIGLDEKTDKNFYNIVPVGSNKPNGGYYSKEIICKIKGFNTNVFDH